MGNYVCACKKTAILNTFTTFSLIISLNATAKRRTKKKNAATLLQTKYIHRAREREREIYEQQHFCKLLLYSFSRLLSFYKHVKVCFKIVFDTHLTR